MLKSLPMPVIWLFLFVSLTLSCKRSLKDFEKSKRPKKIPRAEFIQESAAAYLPTDVLTEIFVHFLDDLRLKRTMINPMLPFFQVSKFWSSQLKSDQIKKFVFGHPKYAYLFLKVSFELSSPNGLDLLRAATPVIDIEAGIKLLLKAQTSSQIDQLGRIPAFQRPISYDTLAKYLSYGRRHGYLSHVIPEMVDSLFDFDPRECIKDFIESKSKLVLHKIPAMEIVKLMVVEDLHDEELFSYIYDFACWQIFRAYWEKQMDAALPLMAALRGLRLPSSGLEALSTVMSYHMICAAIVGDHALFHFLNVDLGNCDSDVFSEPEVVEIIKQFVDGRIECFPANKLTLIRQNLKDGCKFNFYTYPATEFAPMRQQIRQNPDITEENKKIARKYLPNFL